MISILSQFHASWVMKTESPLSQVPRPRPRLEGFKTETKTLRFQDQDRDSEFPRPRPRLVKMGLETSRDQDSSLENSESDSNAVKHDSCRCTCTMKRRLSVGFCCQPHSCNVLLPCIGHVHDWRSMTRDTSSIHAFLSHGCHMHNISIFIICHMMNFFLQSLTSSVHHLLALRCAVNVPVKDRCRQIFCRD